MANIVYWDDNLSGVTLSNNNLTIELNSSIQWITNVGRNTGKYYFEIQVNQSDGQFGVGKKETLSKGDSGTSRDGNSIAIYSSGLVYPGAQQSQITASKDEWIGILMDLDNNKIGFTKNDIVYYSNYQLNNWDELYPYVRGNSKYTANFGSSKFNIVNTNLKLWEKLQQDGYKPYDFKSAIWMSNNKFLIKQNDDYYALKSNFYRLGQPTDNNQLDEWYKKYGENDVNILTQNLNYKDTPMNKDDTTGIWKTDFQLDANDIIDNVQLVENENNKTIKYGCNEYRILDLVDNEFEIKMMKEI